MRIIIIQRKIKLGQTHTYFIDDSESINILDKLAHKLQNQEPVLKSEDHEDG